jgi:alginate O-acetyltransferase complex protein AlgI
VSLTSPLFFLLLAPAGIVFYLLPGRFRALYLLAASYLFYASASRMYLALLLVASATSYALGLAIAKSKDDGRKSLFLFAGVVVIVAIVAVFKAAGAWKGLLLPLGISYYSFKLISYLIEVYWDEKAVERDPIIFFLFPAFFPQIVSGPIQRGETFFAQMRDVMRRGADGAQIETGFAFILGGLMLKMIIGDRLANFVDLVNNSPGEYHYSIILTAVVCYILQLFADFAGYTYIALGVGKIFGVEGPPNFDAPFVATNIQAFWRRWHMSLTLWLTDYLFTPLSMVFRNLGRIGVAIALTVNMVVLGLWHGFTLNFMVFGLIQALYLNVTVVALGWRARHRPKGGRQAADRWLSVAGAALTFALMTFSLTFFFSPTLGHALAIVSRLLGLVSSGTVGWSDLGADFALSIWICMAGSLFIGLGCPGMKGIFARVDAVAPRWAQYGVGLFLWTVLFAEGSGQFIYGQF